eukprot:453266_1
MSTHVPKSVVNVLNAPYFPISTKRWIPDKGNNFCMSCRGKFKSEGIFKSGKHHCRKCGNLVCSDCSKYQLKQQRVCHECYHKYQHYEFDYGQVIADPRLVSKLLSIEHKSDQMTKQDCIRACEEVENKNFIVAKEWLLKYLEWKIFYPEYKPKESYNSFFSYNRKSKQCNQKDELISINDCCFAVRRISVILQYYHKWVENKIINSDDEKKVNTQTETSTGMYDYLNMDTIPNYSNTILLNDLHHFLTTHSRHNSFFNLFCNEYKCNLVQCQLMKRMFGDRVTDTNIRKKQYFGYTNSKEITTQQLLDRIHCYLYHSIDTGFRNDFGNITDNKQLMNLRDNVNKNKEKHKQFMGNHRMKHSKFVTEVIEQETIPNYSFGVQYYYNDFDKNNQTILSFGLARCHRICNFYVHPKYPNMKHEILNNKTYNLNQNEYNEHVSKVNELLKCEKYLAMKCKFQHISSLALYTDFDALQREFSKTYRKINLHENIQSLIQRHSEFANWGKTLSQTILQFGIVLRNNCFAKFYHGISKVMYFRSTLTRFLCPTSFTGQITVAYNFATNDGMVIEISRYNQGNDNVKFFDVKGISNFMAEDEKLFHIGSNKYNVEIKNIINVKLSQSYQKYLDAINTVQLMVKGDMFHGNAVGTMEIIRTFFQFKLNIATEMIGIPKYVANLFNGICDEVILFDMNLDRIDAALVGAKVWDYTKDNDETSQKFRLIANDIKTMLLTFDEYYVTVATTNYKWINLYNICLLFPKLRQITVHRTYESNVTFNLSHSILKSVLSFLDCKEMKKKQFSLCWIMLRQLNEQYMSIEEAIMAYGSYFSERGWGLNRVNKNKNENCLLIGTFDAIDQYFKLIHNK